MALKWLEIWPQNCRKIELITVCHYHSHFLYCCHYCCRFARVLSLQVKQVARSLHLRFTCFTGDAMGMNMVSKVTSSLCLCTCSADLNLGCTRVRLRPVSGVFFQIRKKSSSGENSTGTTCFSGLGKLHKSIFNSILGTQNPQLV